MKKPKIPLDRVAAKIAALGVPGLVLVAVMAWSGYAGAAAITAALAALGGPAGMLGGIAALLVLSHITHGLAEFGFDALFKAVLEDLRKQGLSSGEVKERIDRYWFLSADRRDKLKRHVDRWGKP